MLGKVVSQIASFSWPDNLVQTWFIYSLSVLFAAYWIILHVSHISTIYITLLYFFTTNVFLLTFLDMRIMYLCFIYSLIPKSSLVIHLRLLTILPFALIITFWISNIFTGVGTDGSCATAATTESTASDATATESTSTTDNITVTESTSNETSGTTVTLSTECPFGTLHTTLLGNMNAIFSHCAYCVRLLKSW